MSTLTIHFLPPKLRPARRLALVVLTLAPFAFGALALALGQDANWDLRNYHFYNAYAFLNGRYGFDLLPSQTPYFYNPVLDVPFYLLAMHVPAMVAGYVLGFVQGLNFILLFMLAHASLIIPNPRHKVMGCALLAALGMLGGGGIAQIGTTFYDNVTSIGLFGSAVLVLRLLNEAGRTSSPSPAGEDKKPKFTAFAKIFYSLRQQERNKFLLAGIPAGLMMGLKLPAVIFCLGLCGALLSTGGTWQRRFLNAFAFGLGVLLGVAIALGPWAWFLQAHFGSPLFPYFNDYFKSPLAPLTSARDMQFVPRGLHDLLLFPFIFAANPYRVGEISWRDWGIPILYVLLPLAIMVRLLFGRTKNRQDAVMISFAARYLLWTAVLSYTVWLVMFGIYRYAVPLEMLAPLLIVFAVGMLPFTIRTRALLAGFILLTVTLSVQPGNWHRRASWNDVFVTADIPPLGDTSHLMILMAGFEPYAHVVTQFPPEIPFIRIQSNFAVPGRKDEFFNAIIRRRIEAHKSGGGRFMILIPPWQHDMAFGALASFDLMLNPGSCQGVTDHLYDDMKLDLCSVGLMKKR